MIKNVKLSSANIRWHLRTLIVAKAQNINNVPRIVRYFSPCNIAKVIAQKWHRVFIETFIIFKYENKNDLKLIY